MKIYFWLLVALTPSLFTSLASADDNVALQWSICDSSPAVVLQKLGVANANKTKSEQITYYDTKPPVFDARGISFRVKGEADDMVSSVKVRFAQKQDISKDADCDWERYGNQERYSCEIQKDLSKDSSSAWSADQLDFVNDYYSVDPKNFVSFGPYNNLKWKIKLGSGIKGTFDTVEAGKLHLMELEIKTTKSEDDETYDKVTTLLQDAGVVLCPVQEGKTSRLFHSMNLSN